MSTPDKRRAHGGTGNHVLRTGSSVRQAHHRSSSLGGGGGSGPAGTGPPAGSGSSSNHHLPAMPQRVAVVNNASTAADGAATDKGKGKDAKAKDTTSTTGGSNSPVTRTTSASKILLDKQRDRDRERDRERESASLTAQVCQKDERIAYLEREMDTMERAFQTQLDRLSAAESETATFWQAKHSALHTKHLRTDTELRLLRAEVDVREAERAELRQGWEVLRQGSEVLRRELKERDEEARRLRGQVRGLKEWVSTSTRADGQTSDEVFGDGMARLGNGLQNWVITNFRKAKLDLSRLDKETTAEVAALVPTYEELAKTAKVHFLQSLVSRVLVDTVFDAYFVGLSPEQTSLFKDMEQLLASFCGGAASESVNQWRASTLSLLLRREAPQLLHDDTAAFAECVVSRTNHLLDRLTGTSTTTTTATTSSSSHGAVEGARDAALRVLVNNSIELARRLVVQKAVLRVFMPVMRPPHERPVLFEASTMEDVGGGADDEEDEGEDGDGTAGGRRRREVWCVVFPGVVKQGDEHGAQMQYRNVICKAKVLCRQE
ncbi:hypothetical protein BBO_02674 [Beauveria brongniartii RCEF 3172]|uniref:Involucrin repeat protein n=1 Tax=Beauveria brongniartii RCEF 3172 TaxID=1081107 RepID=A0A167GXF4_9HYPO|nr:hypothetical protein BBO_02674 [Beauveria brongniartii RCEF 3172]